jgi:Phage integrase family
VSFEQSQIHVRRTWTCGAVGVPKSKASKAPVPLHLCWLSSCVNGKTRRHTPNRMIGVFPFRCKGKQPRTTNMLVEDHLRPAAVAAGVLKEGQKVRFGFYNLRHSLASFLVRTKTDPKTVQALLRHSDVRTTLQLYVHSISEDRMAAQGEMLQAILQPVSSELRSGSWLRRLVWLLDCRFYGVDRRERAVKSITRNSADGWNISASRCLPPNGQAKRFGEFGERSKSKEWKETKNVEI